MRPTNSFLGIFSFLSSIPFSSAECTRESLLTTANTYLSAQISGSLTSLPLSTTNFTYRENNKIIDLKKGILSTPLKVSFNRSTADTTSCASYTNLIVTTGSKPYVISTQIRHAMNSTDVVMIDSIVATSKDLFFNATLTQSYLLKENWGMVQGARSSREELKRIGDAYLDMWTDAKAADSIPWGTDCERVEGSALTRPCGAQLPHGGSAKANDMRRYVIDEMVGSVDVLCNFASLGQMPDSHEIRVESGKVKYVHTVTVLS